MNEKTPGLIGDTPIIRVKTEGGVKITELDDVMPNGIVEPNSELAMKIARRIREQRTSNRTYSVKRKQAWKDRSFAAGDY